MQQVEIFCLISALQNLKRCIKSTESCNVDLKHKNAFHIVVLRHNYVELHVNQ